MPYSRLTDEELQAFLVEYMKMTCLPGVALVTVEYVDPRSTKVGVVVTVYEGDHRGLVQLPVTVGGLPVIVKVENVHTGRVMEVIDPRKNGGKWPGTNHNENQDG